MRLRYSKLLTKLGWVVIPVFLLVSLLGSNFESNYIYIPFIFSAVFLGMPHGAVDHLVPRYISDYTTVGSLYRIVSLYLIAGFIYTIMWFISPSLSLALFILLTILHWGQGDTYIISKVFSADYLTDSKSCLSLGLIIRGSIPMLLPYVFYRDRYIEIIGEIVGIFSSGVGVFRYMDSQTAVYIVSGLFALTTITYILLCIDKSNDSLDAIYLDISELILLILLFYALPPILSIGLYFCFWHSCRHIGRLLDTDDVLHDYNMLRATKRFIIISTPMTLGGLVLIGAIWSILGQPMQVGDRLLGIYLVGIAIMTLPHFLVVTWMDMKQSVYS